MLDLLLDVTPEEMDSANAEFYDSAIEPSAPEGMEDAPFGPWTGDEDDWLPSPPDEIWVVGKVVKDV